MSQETDNAGMKGARIAGDAKVSSLFAQKRKQSPDQACGAESDDRLLVLVESALRDWCEPELGDDTWRAPYDHMAQELINLIRPAPSRPAPADAAQPADPWLPIARDEPEVLTEATHPDAPGLGWKLSAEAQAALDAIDASQRAAAVQFAHLIIGSAAPARQQEEPS